MSFLYASLFALCLTATRSLASWSRRYRSLKWEHSLAPQALCNLHDLLFLSIPHSNFCRMMTFATWPTTPAVLSVISSATPGEWRSFEYHFFPVGPGLQLEVCLAVLPPQKSPFWDCANASSCNILGTQNKWQILLNKINTNSLYLFLLFSVTKSRFIHCIGNNTTHASKTATF